MIHHNLAFITDVKYVSGWILRDLVRMYRQICFCPIRSVVGIKKAIDLAYLNTDNGYIEPIPVYVYTQVEVSEEVKTKIHKYCNSLGVMDVCFKVHV